jgi:hypothetical protein
MKNTAVRVHLNASPTEAAKLRQLQAMFAQACNALAPLVQRTKVWNRVALHHMAYKSLREQFPQMGSQMVCNAIYSVSRHSRLVYQDPSSPFNLARLGGKPLPRLHFDETCPVYFDRHTLSIKDGQLSMYTLDGRMRFQVALAAHDEQNFREKKLREVVLSRSAPDRFELSFVFSEKDVEQAPPEVGLGARLPAYMAVEEMNERPQ